MTQNKNGSNLRNLGAANGRNQFTNSPTEFIIPESAKVVFVSDLFAKDYVGGAELTSEALIAKAPTSVFRIHSQSLTREMLDRNPGKYWILCNFTQVDHHVLNYIANNRETIKYSVVEYDYKYCVFRSEAMHQKQTNSPCSCPLSTHAITVEKLYTNARHVFWMSEAQKEHFLSRIPSLYFCDEGHHVIQGSTFEDKDLDYLLAVKEEVSKQRKLPVKIWAIQGSQNWIKGTQETINWCLQNKMTTRIIENMSYPEFIKTMASCHGLVFRPLDLDTCPRVVIEAKILGLELSLNDNVQHQNDSWFKDKSPDEIVAYLRTRGDFFWSKIEL